MDLNHDSATERYTETLNSALSYFSSLAQSNAGWKRLSSASVRPQRNSSSGSPGSTGKGGVNDGSPLLPSSPIANRNSHYHDDPMAYLPGGSTPSSAASAAIESLLPSISVSKKSVPGKSAEIVRASIILPGLNEQTDLEDWRAILECTGARKIWDQMVESSTVLMTLDDSTCITKTIFKTTWPASPRDALLIETTLLDHNAVLHIATSIKPSEDDPIFLRPSPPHVRAYLPLVVWHIQLVPADLDDTVSFTSFNSLSTSQNKPVMPRHSIRVSFYYQIDMRGWAVNSSVSMQSHVPSCIANVYRLLRRQGVPPHVSRHSQRIQLDLNEYDPATGIYELRYDVIPADSDDLLMERKTVSNALKQFRLGNAVVEEGPEFVKDSKDSLSIPQDLVLSDDDEADDLENEHPNEASQNGHVDVELDGEKWGLGSDIVVHIFMNDIEDEEFVQEHVECLKYMGRNRYILRMKHTDIGANQGAINVKLRIERIPQQQQNSSGANLLSHQQLRFQRQQQEQERQQQQQQKQQGEERIQVADMNGLIVSVNGQEKNIRPFHRPTIQGAKRVSMSLQEQLELSQQIVQEVSTSSSHWRAGSDSLDGQESRAAASPLLLMSSSMPTTMQSLNRSSQSILSNGTSTMSPGNSNPSKVNNSYSYFSSLLQEPALSWKPVTKQRGVQVSKLEVQGHVPGIVKGEGIFEDYTIWDIKAALDCASARKLWDKMFDESHMLQQTTPSSTLSYLRLKGFWPTSPKDMAVLNTTFITKDAIHYFATSVDDSNLYPSIPPPVSPFVRSELVVSGWYLETIRPQSVRIVYIAQAAPTGWMVPGSALGAMTTEMPLCVAEIIKYLETHGSPPTLVSIRRGRALGVDYSHAKTSFRLEYVQDSNPIFSGHRVALQQQQQQQQQQALAAAADRQRRSTVDYTAGVGSPESPQFNSPKLGPTDKLLAEIRLDARVWARNGDCEITIDPPPSKVTCTCVPHDGTGYRLRIEHSSGRAVPAGGKVLLMARKPAKPGCGLIVNGVAIKMPSMEHLETWTHRKALSSEKDRSLTMSLVDGALSEKENQEDDEEDVARSKGSGHDPSASVLVETSQPSAPGTPMNNIERKRCPTSLMSPLQYAQGAMDLLMKIKSDSEDTWSMVSDSKGGMRVTKRFMPSEISDQVPLVRGEKVIEGFSLEEIASVIGTLGTRSKLDDLYESGEMIESFGAGCAIFHHVLKSYFPLPLPARDLYFITVTASAEASARCPQIVIVSTSIPHEVTATPSGRAADAPSISGTLSSKPVQPRPRAHLHLSAWILEGIDPYSSSHPIPSTRVTYMTALDLGGSVPQRISGLLQTTFPKMITHVENYLQQQAAPPIVRVPEQMITGQCSDDVSIDERRQERPLLLSPVLPWNKPASKMLSWDFKIKDSFCEMMLLFDQFRLYPSRLDLATERRIKKSKKQRRKSRGSKDNSHNADQPNERQDDHENKALDTKDGPKIKNRTVLELVVDLKQYPMGYNIMTNIKVDPEFLLQHKQQRDFGMKQSHHQLMVGSTSNLVLAGSTSTTTLANISAATTSSSKFIGGFDHVGSALDSGSSGRLSMDGGDGSRTQSTSEAASSGTGIAAVLGSSANVPRALPSSTSLIRILPPPITVNVIDIPPAPSHSSSLSGVSKRRKHLIIITVPEAESSVAHVNALQQQQQQAATASQTPKGSTAPHVVSGTTAKPVVTASSVTGTTSTMFSPEDRIDSKQHRHQASSSSSHDTDSVIEAIRPSFYPGRPPPSATEFSVKHPLQAHGAAQSSVFDLETRLFLFDVKIDRLEHKDLDHAASQVTKDSLGTETNDKEWLGKVMVDGMPVKVVTNWSRHELGYLDGMMEEVEEGAGQRDRRDKSSSKNLQQNGDYSDKDEGRDSIDEEGSRRRDTGEDMTEEATTPRTVTRKKKHRRQQLATMQQDGQEPQLFESPHGLALGATASNDCPQPAATNVRPSGSMYGLSNFLMNVGFLGSTGSQRGSATDLKTAADGSLSGGGGSGHRNDRHLSSTIEYEELDDDRTIRASKSISRGDLSGILNNGKDVGNGSDMNSNKRAKMARAPVATSTDHDLDLESLHGSIVFKNNGCGDSDDCRALSGHEDEGQDLRVGPLDGRRVDRDVSEWARQSGSVRRRKSKGAAAHSDEHESGRSSLEMARRRGSVDHDQDSGLDSESTSTMKHSQHRHRGSRSSTHQRSKNGYGSTAVRRHGSTNGADHPRFRGSSLYAYSFRNLFWSAIACFLVGLLLRVYVIGPSYTNTVSPSNSGGSGSATYYYYYHAAAPKNTAGSSSSSTSSSSRYSSTSSPRDDQQSRQGHDAMDSSVWPQGILEVFTVRRILGWDFVLLAYPSQDQQQQ